MSQSNGHPDPPHALVAGVGALPLDQRKAYLARLRNEERRLLKEQAYLYDGFHIPYPWDDYYGGPIPPTGYFRAPVSYPQTRDHKQPAEAPAGILSEPEWWQHIVMARSLDDNNATITGFVELLTNIVLGDGFTRQVILRGNKPGATVTGDHDRDADGEPDIDPAVAHCQEFLSEWEEYQEFGQGVEDRESENVRRSLVEGDLTVEWFLGGRKNDYLPKMRNVDPELIRKPHDETTDGPYSWGLLTDPDDVEDVQRVWIVDHKDPTRGREVKANRFTRAKFNTVRLVKRGLSDLYPLGADGERFRKLLRNLAEVAAVQASIALMTNYAAGVTGPQVNSMIAAGADYQTTTPATPYGEARTFETNHLPMGAWLHSPKDQETVAGPVTTGSDKLIAVAQFLLRNIGHRFNIPEFASGDASNNNYASTLSAGAPFERAAKRRQKRLAGFEKVICLKVLELGAEAGRLSQADVDKVTIKVDCPPVAMANRLEDEQIRQGQFDRKVLSRRTYQSQVGLDPKVEAANVKAEAAADQAMQPQGFGGPGGGGGGGGPDEGPGGFGGRGGPGRGGGGGPFGESINPDCGCDGLTLEAHGLTSGPDGLIYEAKSSQPFSGRIVDALGRARCYHVGKAVPCHDAPDSQVRKRARDLLSGANPAAPLTRRELEALDNYLKSLNVHELKDLQTQFLGSARGKRLKGERVGALLDYARGQTVEKPKAATAPFRLAYDSATPLAKQAIDVALDNAGGTPDNPHKAGDPVHLARRLTGSHRELVGLGASAGDLASLEQAISAAGIPGMNKRPDGSWEATNPQSGSPLRVAPPPDRPAAPPPSEEPTQPTPEAKQPHEMTKDEWEQAKQAATDRHNANAKRKKDRVGGLNPPPGFQLTHLLQITAAMNAGKTIPDHVRRQYAHLKQPHEMTQAEYDDHFNRTTGAGPNLPHAGKQMPGSNLTWGQWSRRNDVERALRTGKPVPPEVLADYPDLAAKQQPAKAPAAPEDPAAFVASVHAAAREIPDWAGNAHRPDAPAAVWHKPTIDDVYDHMARTGRLPAGMTLDQFKAKLDDLRRTGQIELGRGDMLTYKGGPERVRRAQITDPATGGQYHLVNTPPRG